MSLRAERKLQAAVLDILIRYWNPGDWPKDRASCECESFVPDIVRRLNSGIPKEELADFLRDKERALIDLDGRLLEGRSQAAEGVAERLTALVIR